jgi:hypothetical protein
LKQIATHIVGVDVAPEMIALAPADPQITYLVAPAEQLPTLETPFNLMTLSSVFHWIRSEAFFAQARRGRHWLMHSITPLFEHREEAHFLFQGPIWYLQKANL